MSDCCTEEVANSFTPSLRFTFTFAYMQASTVVQSRTSLDTFGILISERVKKNSVTVKKEEEIKRKGFAPPALPLLSPV